jgi:hypothetical protein
MAITPLPTPPNRSMTPAAFITAADAFIEALPQFQEEANAAAEAMDLNDTTSTSTTSVVIGTGAKSLTVQASKSYVPGMTVKIARTSDGTKWMVGDVTSYNSGTGALAVTVSKIQGSGTFTDWTISFASTEQLTADSISTAMLQDDAVTSAKIAADAILAEHLSDSVLGFAMINGTLTASVAGNAFTVAIKTKAGTDPSAADPVLIVFRNATITDGTYSVVSVTAATSLVVSSGSTLGTVNAQAARLAVLLLNNAGTAELAINNLSGGVNLDETGVISTTAEGGAGAADSATVVYSTAARTNVAYRVVGIIDITEATAGTWASGPTKLTLVGTGQALAMSSLGFGQTWQDVTGSRALSTTYYNTTGRPIQVCVTLRSANASGTDLAIVVNGVTVVSPTSTAASGYDVSASVIVPPGGSYSATGSNSGSLNLWSELR